MKKLITIIIALFVVGAADAKSHTKKGKQNTNKEVVTKFRKNLTALIQTTNQPSGFDALKQIELSRGVWNCKLELDGFLPTVKEEPNNPTGKLIIAAISVTPAASKNVKQLLQQGISGYKMSDSDNDKTILLDRSKYLRKVVFTKKEKFIESTVTVLFVAHKYESTQIIIEAWQ